MDSPAIFGKAATPEEYLERGKRNSRVTPEWDAGEDGSPATGTHKYQKEQVHGHGRGRDQSELLVGLENMRVSGDLGSPTLETSPYYEYALSALDDFDGVVNHAGHDLRISELACLHREIDSSRLWLIEYQSLLGGLPLPATANLGKLFERLKTTCENIWDLPNKKQNRAVTSCTDSLRKAFGYLTGLMLLQSILWSVELVDAAAFEDMREVVRRLTETRVSDIEFRAAAQQTGQIVARVLSLRDSMDAKGKQAVDRIHRINEILAHTFRLDDRPRKGVIDKVKSILKPTHARDGRIMTPISATTSAKGVYSSKECFTTPPVPIAKAIEEPDPELYNYNGQVVTRSAMELLEKEDQLAAKGGLFERDGVVMTASALSLLQAQEALDRADSAGQGEYGPDSWDAIRGQYIPKWAKKLEPADQWPLVQEDGRMPIFYEDGTKMEDWYDVNLDVVEARNLQKFGIGGVVDHPY